MHSDRVICYWCAVDDTSDYQYEYLYNISYDGACLKADKESMKLSLQNHTDEIVEEAKKNCDINNIMILRKSLTAFFLKIILIIQFIRYVLNFLIIKSLKMTQKHFAATIVSRRYNVLF